MAPLRRAPHADAPLRDGGALRRARHGVRDAAPTAGPGCSSQPTAMSAGCGARRWSRPARRRRTRSAAPPHLRVRPAGHQVRRRLLRSPLGAHVAVTGEAERQNARYALIAPGGAVVHAASRGRSAQSSRTGRRTAERFLGAPYLWGGKTQSRASIAPDSSRWRSRRAGIAAPRDTRHAGAGARRGAAARCGAAAAPPRRPRVLDGACRADARRRRRCSTPTRTHMAVAIEPLAVARRARGGAGRRGERHPAHPPIPADAPQREALHPAPRRRCKVCRQSRHSRPTTRDATSSQKAALKGQFLLRYQRLALFWHALTRRARPARGAGARGRAGPRRRRHPGHIYVPHARRGAALSRRHQFPPRAGRREICRRHRLRAARGRRRRRCRRRASASSRSGAPRPARASSPSSRTRSPSNAWRGTSPVSRNVQIYPGRRCGRSGRNLRLHGSLDTTESSLIEDGKAQLRAN